MKVFIKTVIISIFMILSISLAYSAVVSTDPASLNSPDVGKNIEISINVKDVIDLSAYQIEFSFDQTAIMLRSIEEGSFLKKDFSNDPKIEGTIPFVMTTTTPSKSVTFGEITPDTYSDINTTGKMVIANSRYSIKELKGVDGEGNLIKLTFQVLVAKASKIQLNAPFNDPKLILVDSKLNVIDALLSGSDINEPLKCVKGDVNNDGKIMSNDAIIALRISAEIITPTDQQLCAADINDDKKVTSLDAMRILRKSAGLDPAPTNQIVANRNAQVSVNLGEFYGVAGNDVDVPIILKHNDSIACGDIHITYDPKVLNIKGISADEGLLLESNISKSGNIKISFADISGFNGNTLAKIKFNVISDSTSRLAIQNIDLYNNDLMPIKPKVSDGLFVSWAVPAKDNALMQNFPNPFNPETWIPFQLKQSTDVVVSIYSATGELVRELDLGNKSAGMYISQDRSAYWDGKDKFGIPVASGVYFYSIKTKDFNAVKKMIILK